MARSHPPVRATWAAGGGFPARLGDATASRHGSSLAPRGDRWQDLLAAFDTVLAGKDGPEADLRLDRSETRVRRPAKSDAMDALGQRTPQRPASEDLGAQMLSSLSVEDREACFRGWNEDVRATIAMSPSALPAPAVEEQNVAELPKASPAAAHDAGGQVLSSMSPEDREAVLRGWDEDSMATLPRNAEPDAERKEAFDVAPVQPPQALPAFADDPGELRGSAAEPAAVSPESGALWSLTPEQESILRDLGLRRRETPGDGHCQFRAVAAAVGEDYLSVRQHAVEWIKAHPEQFQPFIEGTLESYLDRMQGDEWGDMLTLQALAEYYGRTIYVISNQSLNTEQFFYASNPRPNSEPIYVLFYKEIHYEATEPVNTPVATPELQGLSNPGLTHAGAGRPISTGRWQDIRLPSQVPIRAFESAAMARDLAADVPRPLPLLGHYSFLHEDSRSAGPRASSASRVSSRTAGTYPADERFMGQQYSPGLPGRTRGADPHTARFEIPVYSRRRDPPTAPASSLGRSQALQSASPPPGSSLGRPLGDFGYAPRSAPRAASVGTAAKKRTAAATSAYGQGFDMYRGLGSRPWRY